MTIRDIHIEIEQRLQLNGVFAYSDLIPSEIDIAINATVDNELRKILRDIDEQVNENNVERNQWVTDFTRVLKVKTELTPTKSGETFKITLPVLYQHLLEDASNISFGCANKETNKIEKGKTYKVVEDISLNNVWYEKDKVFTATETVTLDFGLVVLVKAKLVQNRLTKSEDLHGVLNSPFTKSIKRSPVSELVGNELHIYAPDFEIASVLLTYFKRPVQANFATNTTLEFNDDVIRYIIDKTAERLAITDGHEQQKIVNFNQSNT